MKESTKNHYLERNNWHKINVPKVALLFENKCYKCSRKTKEEEGAIHHLQYTGFDYKKTAEELIAKNAIIWICKKCHVFEHIAYSINEVNYKTKHSGYCAVCNKFSWHAWYTMGFGRAVHSRHNRFPLCNKCKETLIKENVLESIIYKGIQFTKFRNKELRSPKGKLICKHLKKKVKIGIYGSLELRENWQNQRDGEQLNLF
jgi:hypothetical protein